MEKIIDKASIIAEGENSIIYLNEQESFGHPVIIKLLKKDLVSNEQLSQLLNEYEISNSLDIAQVRKPISKTKFGNKLAIILPYIKGITLKEYVQKKSNSLADKLALSLSLTNAISALHQHNVIHKNINCANIIVNDNNEAFIIDLGISTRLNLKKEFSNSLHFIEGDLQYISPEQTGRVNRYVDYRTDLYSLGVVLYALFTGRLPFNGQDALEIIQKHIAAKPAPPHQIAPELPPIISRIILKLLEKNSEDRYQSAYGVHKDLQQVLRNLGQHPYDPGFSLAQNDGMGKFNIPQTLFGREKELNQLLRAFDRAGSGFNEVVFIAGYSGIGKTSLVNEIHKPVTSLKGNFIACKLDKTQQNTPFGGLRKPLITFIDSLLSIKEKELSYWRNKIKETLKEEAGILYEILPNLELLLGTGETSTENTNTEEAQRRLLYAFKTLVQLIADKKHPLVLFLDDVQWADSMTLKLIETMANDADIEYFLLIASYRDSEVLAAHPLLLTLSNVRKMRGQSEELFLKNLEQEEITQLVASTLNTIPQAVSELAQIVYEKTDGNPLFTIEFLKSLRDQEALYFVYKDAKSTKGEWHWDSHQIQQFEYSNSVVELLISTVNNLEPQVKTILKYAACLGNRFNFNILWNVIGIELQEMNTAIVQCINHGLIMPLNQDGSHLHSDFLNDKIEFRFVHDKIQQAAYSLIPKEDLNGIHFKIGKELEVFYKKDTSLIYEMVFHLNLGLSNSKDKIELEKLLRLNGVAGKRALATSSFQSAFEYYQKAYALMVGHFPGQQKPGFLEIHMGAAESANLCADYVEMEGFLQECAQYTMDQIQRSRLDIIKIKSFIARNNPIAAVELGNNAIKALGIEFPTEVKQYHIVTELIKTEIKIRRIGRENLLRLPDCKNERVIAIFNLISSFGPLIYRTNPKQFLLTVFKIIQLNIKYGKTEDTIPTIAGYGIVHCGALSKLQAGFQYGQLALQLMKESNNKSMRSKTLAVYGTFLHFWKKPLQETLPIFQDSYYAGLESGDLEFSAISLFMYSLHAFCSGKELFALSKDMEDYGKRITKLNQNFIHSHHSVFQQTVINLNQTYTDENHVLEGEFFKESRISENTGDYNAKILAYYVHINRLVLCYYLGKNELAIEAANNLHPIKEQGLSSILHTVYLFFSSLAYAREFDLQPKHEQKKRLKFIKSAIKSFRLWAQHAPENFQHRHLTLSAVLLGIQNEVHKAIPVLEEALSLSIKSEFLNDEALLLELLGCFYSKAGQNDLAELNFQKAYQTYQKWGAIAKSSELALRYPDYIQTSASIGHKKTTPAEQHNLNKVSLNKVMEASTQLSKVLNLPKAISTILEIAGQAVPSKKTVLLLQEDQQIKVVGFREKNRNTAVPSIKISESAYVASSVVKYVFRNRQTIVIDQVQKDMRFSKDNYLEDKKPLFLLCMPILKQGDIVGILYFESEFKAKPDNPQIEFLTLLGGQIATTLQNSILYANMEKKVSDRKKEILQQQLDLKNKNDKLIELNSEKDHLISIVSHDLRSPLNQIRGLAELIKMENNTAVENMDMIIDSTDRLNNMIHRILDVNGIESKNTSVQKRQINLNSLLQKLKEGFSPEAKIKESTIRVENKTEIEYFTSDLDYINLILENLLSNAIKFSPNKSTILLSTLTQGDALLFSVKDQGPGILQEEEHLLFKKFQRLSAKPTANEPTTGLGLSIVKKYTLALKGKVWYTSKNGDGTTFYISIPR